MKEKVFAVRSNIWRQNFFVSSPILKELITMLLGYYYLKCCMEKPLLKVQPKIKHL